MLGDGPARVARRPPHTVIIELRNHLELTDPANSLLSCNVVRVSWWFMHSCRVAKKIEGCATALPQ
jgi:hypothetical protein